MKRALYFIVICILILCTSCTGVKGTGNKMVESLEEIGADIVEMDINFGGAINEKFLSESEIIELGRGIKEKMGIVGEKVEGNFYEKNYDSDCYSENITVEDHSIQYNIWGKNENGEAISIFVTSYLDKESGSGETTVFVDMIKTEEYGRIDEIMEKRRAIFKQNENKAEITTCIIGSFNGKLSRNEIDKKIQMTINKINGKIIENYEDENLVSITAYTPLINNYIYTGNKKMNYNVAMRYNEYEDKTYIWIGTPIITIGY